MTAPLLADRVAEIWTGTGTGTVTPGGALTGGYRTWGGAFAEADEVRYVIAHRGLAEYEVGVGTIGAGGTLTRDTVVESSNADALVNFSAGEKDVFCAIDAASLMGIGITRVNVPITTPLMAIGDVYEAAVTDFGRLFRLLQLTAQAERGAWIRFYGSEADMDADLRTDPTVAVTDEAVLAEAVLYDVDLTAEPPAGVHGKGVFLDNTEDPQLGRLWVRITRLDETGGVTPEATMIGSMFANGGGADINLNTVAPTAPGATGLSEFEYAGAADAWKVYATGFGYAGTYKLVSSTFGPARTDVDLWNENLRLTADIRRPGPGVPGYAGVAWCLSNDALGAWVLEDLLYVRLHSAGGGADDVRVELLEVTSSGHNTLAQSDVLTFAGGDLIRLVVEVVDGSPNQLVSAWVADHGTGLNPVLVLEDEPIPDFRTVDRKRVGVVYFGSTNQHEMAIDSVFVEDLTNPGATNAVTLQALGDRFAA